jgi:hypothetical protein
MPPYLKRMEGSRGADAKTSPHDRNFRSSVLQCRRRSGHCNGTIETRAKRTRRPPEARTSKAQTTCPHCSTFRSFHTIGAKKHSSHDPTARTLRDTIPIRAAGLAQQAMRSLPPAVSPQSKPKQNRVISPLRLKTDRGPHEFRRPREGGSFRHFIFYLIKVSTDIDVSSKG